MDTQSNQKEINEIEEILEHLRTRVAYSNDYDIACMFTAAFEVLFGSNDPEIVRLKELLAKQAGPEPEYYI